MSGTGAGPGEHRGASLRPASEGLAGIAQDGQSAAHAWSGASLPYLPHPPWLPADSVAKPLTVV